MGTYEEMNDEELYEALRERVRACISYIPCSNPGDGKHDSFSVLHILGIIKERLADDARQGRPLRPLFRPVAETMAVTEKQHSGPVLSLGYRGPSPAPLRAALALQSLLLPEAAMPENDWGRLVEQDRKSLQAKALLPG